MDLDRNPFASTVVALRETLADLGNLHASVNDERRARLEGVPYRFLEWTMVRVQSLHWVISASGGEMATVEAAALSARLLLEALWILRWIDSQEDRAKEFLERACIRRTAVESTA